MKTIGSLITRRADARAVKPEAKWTDPFYLSPEYQAWRSFVIKRAGARCEVVDEQTGQRCTKAAPRHRMFADHIVERRDAPHLELDPANGQCKCGAHHSLKTAVARAARLAR